MVETGTAIMEDAFDRERHVLFFTVALKRGWKNPSADSMKMTVLYFVISALDLLNALEVVDSKAVVEWIYAQQVSEDAELRMNAGFRVGVALRSASVTILLPIWIFLNEVKTKVRI